VWNPVPYVHEKTGNAPIKLYTSRGLLTSLTSDVNGAALPISVEYYKCSDSTCDCIRMCSPDDGTSH